MVRTSSHQRGKIQDTVRFICTMSFRGLRGSLSEMNVHAAYEM